MVQASWALKKKVLPTVASAAEATTLGMILLTMQMKLF
jgi:hypothetical protein